VFNEALILFCSLHSVGFWHHRGAVVSQFVRCIDISVQIYTEGQLLEMFGCCGVLLLALKPVLFTLNVFPTL